MSSRSPSLLRQLGLASATAYVVSNMIGTGIFGSTGFLIADLGSPSEVLLIWVVGAVCALAGAFCYSELGINFPSSGGEYVYLSKAFGPTWGFLSGWVSFFAGFSAPIAAAALAFSNYLAYLNPALQEGAARQVSLGFLTLRLGAGQLLACGLILLLTMLNMFGIGFISRIQNVLTATKIGVLVVFILAAFIGGSGDWSHFSQTLPTTGDAAKLTVFAASLYWVYTSYSGWNAATYVAEEIEQPAKNLPLALSIGTALVAALYLLLNVVFIYAIPLEKMAGQPAVGSIASVYLFGDKIAAVFSVLFAIGLMSTVNAMVTIGPRVYYAMAQNGAFLSWAGYVHPTWRTPIWAILGQGLCSCLMALSSFRDLVAYVGFTLNFFAALAVCSLFFFRRRAGWQKLPAVSFAWPLIPIIFLAISAWGTYFGFKLQPRIGLIAIGTVVLGGLFYRFVIAGRTAPIR